MTRVGQVDPLTTALCSFPFPSTHSLVLVCSYGREAGLRKDERAKVARMLVLIQRGVLRRQIDQVKARLVAMHGVQYDLWSGEGVGGGGKECDGSRGTEEGRLGGYMWWIHTLVRRMPSDGGCCCFLFGAFWKRPKNNKQKWKTPFGGA